MSPWVLNCPRYNSKRDDTVTLHLFGANKVEDGNIVTKRIIEKEMKKICTNPPNVTLIVILAVTLVLVIIFAIVIAAIVTRSPNKCMVN